MVKNNVNKRRTVQFHVAFIFIMTFLSCKSREVTLCSPISNKCISIIDHDNIRHIYYGQMSSENYVKLDISQVDLEADGIFICWNSESNKLEVVNPKTRIMEVKLDTTSYQFSNIHNVDKIGIPKVLKFHQNGNIEFNMWTKSIFPLDTNVKISVN